MEVKIMAVETLYTCGRAAKYATLLLQEDGLMMVRDDAGGILFVYKSFTPQKAIEVLSSFDLLANQCDLFANQEEDEDSAYDIFWRAIHNYLGL